MRPVSADPFEILALEPEFELEEGRLAERHKELSLALHPDRFAGSPSAERRAALSRAIEVNAAHRALKDPVRRAEALLARLGVETGEGREPPADPEFLFEIMELREELSEAGRKRDRARLDELVQRSVTRELQTKDRLAALFRQARGGGTLAAATQAELLGLLGQLRYLRRLFDEAGALLDELDAG